MTAPTMTIPELRTAELHARVTRGMAYLDELHARVTRGMAYLDEHDPGWWRVDAPSRGDDSGPIDLDELNMAHNCYCVLGQRFGNYYRVRISLDDAVACGFDTQIGSARPERPVDGDAWYAAMQDEFDALRQLWTRVIEGRRGEPPERPS